MSPIQAFLIRRAGAVSAVAAAVFYAALAANAQSPVESANARVDFDAADLPAPSVELNLSQGMFQDLFGIGDTAVAGVAESLLQVPDSGQGSDATRLAAEQLAAARQIMQLASEVVQEVRIRVYKDFAAESIQPEVVAARFDEQLRAGKWDNVIGVRENEKAARISLLRGEGAVQGVFVIAQEGKQLVLANVVCDVSPENVHQLTSAATKIGLENGLAQAIEAKMQRMQKHGHVAPPEPPQPPRPDRPGEPR